MPKPTSNFLRKFVSLFKDTEVPERFATWAGVSCISAILERRIWIDMNIYMIYPNTYIIFVADSGRMRKSTAIKMTYNLLAKVDPGPRLIAQKITPEGLIDALRVIHSDDPSKLLRETCGGIVVADELVSFINNDTYQRGLGGLLTELWDCPDKYEYRTRNRPVEKIDFGHLSLLGGTTVHNLKDAIPIQAMGDGFSSRVLFVYADEIPKPIPRPILSEGFRRIKEDLVLHLQKLTALNGEVTLSPQATTLFDEEYEKFFYSKYYEDAQFQAYASRRDKHLLKVAMCLMAAEDLTMVLDIHHITGAKILLEDIEEKMGEVFDRISMTETGSTTERVYLAIKASPGQTITRSDLLRKFSHKLSAKELSHIIETLCWASRIKIDTSAGTGVIMYKAT